MIERFSRQFVEELLSQFGNKTLPEGQWTHEAHILVAFWHNWYFDFVEAFELVKSKIIAYNEAVGTENSDQSGYHETLTVFWMTLTRNYLHEHNFTNLEVAIQSFLQTEKAFKTIPLKYYSKELLFSTLARRQWVQGDIEKLVLKEEE